MNDLLRNRISQLRTALENDPSGPIAGEIRAPNTNAETSIERWDQFLAEANGGRFGAIDIWSVSELEENQFYSGQMQGGSNAWLVVGQILYEPLAVFRDTDEVVLHSRMSAPKTLGDIDFFLAFYLFGDGYAEVIPDHEHEEWWRVIKSGEPL